MASVAGAGGLFFMKHGEPFGYLEQEETIMNKGSEMS